MRRFRNASKQAIHLTLNSQVLALAREMGLAISPTVDQLLAAEVERVYWERWRHENAAAIAHYNARIAHEGTFGQLVRRRGTARAQAPR